MVQPTWQPILQTREMTDKEREALPDYAFAFPKQRKEPLMDAAHVRNAVARFNQVQDVTEADRDLAWANIQKAAKHFEVMLNEMSWRGLK
jgi:hypothetical protein